jgi:hypothetical protein
MRLVAVITTQQRAEIFMWALTLISPGYPKETNA